ncbi:MAG: hypothetical protein A4E64_00477 [Syntrophorhabdus sp. PtaU1.Bin058]|nr:MAG: hypothetical protein A4E64_00477 [Syntrophorhabdus sp. PtaU1.Bin058]
MMLDEGFFEGLFVGRHLEVLKDTGVDRRPEEVHRDEAGHRIDGDAPPLLQEGIGNHHAPDDRQGDQQSQRDEPRVHVGVTGAGKYRMGGIERLEPVEIKPEGQLHEEQEYKDGQVLFCALHERDPVAEHEEAATGSISRCYPDDGDEKEEAGKPVQRFIEGQLEEVEAEVLAEYRVRCPRIYAVEKGEHLRPEAAPPECAYYTAEEGDKEAEEFEHLAESAGIKGHPHLAHEQYVDGRYLDRGRGEDIGGKEDKEDKTEGKARQHLCRQDLREHPFVCNLPEEEPVHVYPGQFGRREKEDEDNSQQGQSA